MIKTKLKNKKNKKLIYLQCGQQGQITFDNPTNAINQAMRVHV